MSSPARQRLDQALVSRRLVASRSQAESYVKLGRVQVNGVVAIKPAQPISPSDTIELTGETFVSRAGLKLASVADKLELDFRGKTVLDVGSSTGGFTDFALRRGAKTVIAVDVGSQQMHPLLRDDPRVELHEKTDIRDIKLSVRPDIVVIDVSFISLRQVLPAIRKLMDSHSQIVAMVKPQFEAAQHQITKGVVKNDSLRRQILKDFESWVKKQFTIKAKADSQVSGAKGNVERFYLLKTSL